MAIDGARAAVRRIGDDLVEAGLAGEQDDAFYPDLRRAGRATARQLRRAGRLPPLLSRPALGVVAAYDVDRHADADHRC